MRVIYKKVVEDYLFDLIEILYQKEYFGFYESAELYVDELIKTIYESIEKLPQKTALPYFDRFGKDMRYITIKKAKTRNDMCFSIHTPLITKQFTLSDTYQTTTYRHTS